ncbi:MAG: RdgB/HAM1 family non-canonical purine NTP pyrophosphatase [Chitinophagales bacterium]|nr:RdgB/HAM1 family non-canonical purine NTP pyrophosphatase [Bacteroidota bacterium]MCB9257034.1 RdgB/HAM1 family non-canonical purine NTP pyrophosphatase [Chitinophagales bacterium]
MELVFATSNPNKLKEVKAIFGDLIQILSLEDINYLEEIEETGATIEENSYLKAKTIFDFCGKAVLAEDTGLEVLALNGAPGVYSARYAGKDANAEKNMQLLLQNMQAIEDRRAQFKTVATFIDVNTSISFEGIILGEITKEKKGKDGFGYDPIFKPAGFPRVFAEMTLQEKSIISHRAIAMQKFVKYMKASL